MINTVQIIHSHRIHGSFQLLRFIDASFHLAYIFTRIIFLATRLFLYPFTKQNKNLRMKRMR